jgi:hypothetical protein
VEGIRLWILEGRAVPKRIFGARMVKEIVGWRQLQSEGECDGWGI